MNKVGAEASRAVCACFVQPVWEVTYLSTALALVRNGLGVTMVPGMDERHIGIFQAGGLSLSPAAEVLLEAMRAG
jgi:hypothetical protein